MKRMATLTGHTYRVLYLAASPDGQTLVTGAGDETLRFWKIFPSNGKNPSKLAPAKANESLKIPMTSNILYPSHHDLR